MSLGYKFRDLTKKVGRNSLERFEKLDWIWEKTFFREVREFHFCEVVADTTTHPIATVKTRLQVQGASKMATGEAQVVICTE